MLCFRVFFHVLIIASLLVFFHGSLVQIDFDNLYKQINFKVQLMTSTNFINVTPAPFRSRFPRFSYVPAFVFTSQCLSFSLIPICLDAIGSVFY